MDTQSNIGTDTLFGAGAGAALWGVAALVFAPEALVAEMVIGAVAGTAVGAGVGFLSDNATATLVTVTAILAGAYLVHKYL